MVDVEWEVVLAMLEAACDEPAVYEFFKRHPPFANELMFIEHVLHEAVDLRGGVISPRRVEELAKEYKVRSDWLEAWARHAFLIPGVG